MADKEVSIWIRAKDQATGVFKKFEQTLNGTARLAKNTARNLLSVGGAAVGVVAGLQRMGAAGARNIAAQRAFTQMTDGNADALGTLQRATLGLVDKQTLMVQSNLALTTGAAKSSDEFGRMANQATLLGRAVGLNAREAVEKYTIALARQSIRRLDDLGIIIDTTEAQQKYADSIGVQVDQLSEAQKAEAFRTEAMRKADELLEQVGDTQNTTAESAERLAASVRDMITALQNAVAASPQVAEFFDLLTVGFKEMADAGSVSAETIAASLSKITDPDAMLRRRNMAVAALDRQKQIVEEARAQLEEVSGGFSLLPKREVVEATRYLEEMELQLRDVQEEADQAGARLVALTRAAAGANVDPGGGGGAAGFSMGAGFTNTRDQAVFLLDALKEADAALEDAKNEQMAATTEEGFNKAAEKVRELQAEVRELNRFIDEYGRNLIRASALGWNDRPAVLNPQSRMDFDFGKKDRNGDPVIRTPPIDIEDTLTSLDRLKIGTEALMDDMIAAVQSGTEITAASVTKMIAQIAKAAIGGPFGQVVSFGFGLLSGILRGRDRKDTVSVRVDEYGPRAQEQMKQQRPYNITSIVETGGNEIERVELELRRRQARDAVARISPPGGR